VAVAWVLSNPAVTGAIVGARRPDQVRDLSEAAEFKLSSRELAEIEAFFGDKLPESRTAHQGAKL
jgi:aryl-alcohol dehydrogenase-like predicted oxidoreductase